MCYIYDTWEDLSLKLISSAFCCTATVVRSMSKAQLRNLETSKARKSCAIGLRYCVDLEPSTQVQRAARRHDLSAFASMLLDCSKGDGGVVQNWVSHGTDPCPGPPLSGWMAALCKLHPTVSGTFDSSRMSQRLVKDLKPVCPHCLSLLKQISYTSSANIQGLKFSRATSLRHRHNKSLSTESFSQLSCVFEVFTSASSHLEAKWWREYIVSFRHLQTFFCVLFL